MAKVKDDVRVAQERNYKRSLRSGELHLLDRFIRNELTPLHNRVSELERLLEIVKTMKKEIE